MVLMCCRQRLQMPSLCKLTGGVWNKIPSRCVSSNPEDKNSRYGICKLCTTCQIFNFMIHEDFKFLPELAKSPSLTSCQNQPHTLSWVLPSWLWPSGRSCCWCKDRLRQWHRVFIPDTHTHSWGSTHPPGLVGSLHTHSHTRLYSYVCGNLTTLNPSNPKQSLPKTATLT